MNIYQKLTQARLMLQSANLKKSGKNAYSGYDYYELGDFLPTINQINAELGIIPIITFSKDVATMTLYNADEPTEFIDVESPIEQIQMKGCNNIQCIGSVETYSRRYLYMTMYEIVESDFNEIQTGKDEHRKLIDERYALENELIALGCKLDDLKVVKFIQEKSNIKHLHDELDNKQLVRLNKVYKSMIASKKGQQNENN